MATSSRSCFGVAKTLKEIGMKQKNAIGTVGFFCTLILLLACHATSPTSGTVTTMYVGPTLADGVGVGPMTCLMVRDSPDSEYQMFYSQIQGFDFVPGFDYELKVSVTEREIVPAEASKYIYELIEVVSAKESGLRLDSVKWALADRIEDSQVDLRFEEGQISGRAGINRYFAGYEQDGSSLRIGNTGSTQMAGPQDLMDQEQAFLSALGSVASFQIVGEQLRLLNGDGIAVLSLVPSLEPALSPNTWSATGVNNGKGGVSSLLAGSKVVVRFDEDGRISGNSGCNRFQGSYEINGESLNVGPLASTRKMCASPEGIMEQEANVLQALEKASTFKMDGSSLELRDDSGALQIKFVLDSQ
jgi:heat shock protein HslJ